MLLIISRPNERTTQKILWLECQTTQGSITILPKHAPFIALIKPETAVTIGLDAERIESKHFSDGYLIVEREQIYIITL